MYTVNIAEQEFQISIDKKEKNKGEINGKSFVLDVHKSKEGSYHVLHNNKSYNIEVVEFDKENNSVTLNINGQNYTSKVNTEIDMLLKKLGMDNLTSKKVNELKAPMPGLVFKILVDVGQEVNEGDNLMILEAMKMEIEIAAPEAGVIKSIDVAVNDAVSDGQLLATLG
jgi:biotin carboxyl carrier protein